METVCNKTEGKVKRKMGRRCEELFEEDGSDQLETKDTGEEEIERNNWARQNPQRVGELKKKKKKEKKTKRLDWLGVMRNEGKKMILVQKHKNVKILSSFYDLKCTKA